MITISSDHPESASMKPELIALTVNIVICTLYVWHGDEPEKVLYWFGAVIMTVGLLLMKG